MQPLDAASVEVAATTPVTLYRVCRDKLDYLIGWSTLLHDLPVEDAMVRVRLEQLRYPAIFMNLPFDSVLQVNAAYLRPMRGIPRRSGAFADPCRDANVSPLGHSFDNSAVLIHLNEHGC